MMNAGLKKYLASKQSKSFGKKMNAKTTMQKGAVKVTGKMAKRTLAKNIRKGKGPARMGHTKKGY